MCSHHLLQSTYLVAKSVDKSFHAFLFLATVPGLFECFFGLLHLLSLTRDSRLGFDLVMQVVKVELELDLANYQIKLTGHQEA